MDYAGADFGPLQRAKAVRDATFFKGCRGVLDLGCGPGHFMSALQDLGVPGYGVDREPASLDALKARSLKGYRSDVLGHLRSLKKGRVDGIHCSNVLEHLAVAEARELMALCAQRLPVGGRLLLATSNAACLAVVAGSFWDDEQHVRPYTARLLTAWARRDGLEVLACRSDEQSRPQGFFRGALRVFRGLVVGPYFEAPELLLLARRSENLV